ncbi:MAG: aminotransferase [Rhizobiales bacterium]|nr:aminotransferase [Hyphomicrobiales bacterium]
MRFRTNLLLSNTDAPPIAEAMTWVRKTEGNRRLLNLSQAVPSYPPAPELTVALAEALREPATSLYTDILGLPELRSALANHFSADYQAQVSPEDVAIVAGCNQAFCAALLALAEPGDNVVLPAPYYFNHAMWLGMLGIEVRAVDCFAGGGPFPALADVERQIDSRTRAIVICSPNNPTGAIYPAELIGALNALAASKGIVLVADETYKDFRDDASPPHHAFKQSGWRESFVQLYSFSKTYALTGYRVGSITASPEFLAEVEKVMDCVAICAPHVGQLAALYGLNHLQSWAAAKRELMASRKAALRKAFGMKGLEYKLMSSGAYFAYVKHPFPDRASKAVAKMLAREHDVLCLPGSMFGPGQEKYLRLAYANVEADAMPLLAERLLESHSSVRA